MRSFMRLFSGVLLILMLGTFTLWRQQRLPDLSGIGDAIEDTAGQLEQTANAIGNMVGTTILRPTDNSSGGGALYRNYNYEEPLPEEFETRILTAYTNMEETIDISSFGYTSDQVQNALARIQYARPEFFYVDAQYQCAEQGGRVTTVRPKYNYTRSEVSDMRITYEAALVEIVSGVDPAWSDFDKALYLHDYFVRNYTYDYTYSIHDAYTLFTQKTGVCQAYMLGLIAAGERVGLEILPVTSNAMNHAWNLVKIDGSWYHADVTWDDSMQTPAGVSYRYFLYSDTGFAAAESADPADRHYDWVSEYRATDTKYDQLGFKQSTGGMVKLNGTYYYIEQRQWRRQECYGAIYGGTDLASMQKLWEISGIWRTDDSGFYEGCFSGLAAYNGRLVYHNSNAVYLYDPATQAQDFLGIVPLPAGQELYGIVKLTGNTVTFWAADDPNAAYNGQGSLVTATLPAA